uniref:Uncharacterized protein n=1 Tax=Biomphalaria glabrata TaxID=6526 RepID=A0A2C9LMW7_BIOGL
IHPPWRHWYNDQVPPYTKPQDRRKAREEREAERERLLQQQRDAERNKKEGEFRERKANEDELIKATMIERARLDKERFDLENQLQEERRKRLDAERKAKEEIEQLRRELDILRKPLELKGMYFIFKGNLLWASLSQRCTGSMFITLLYCLDYFVHPEMWQSWGTR